MEGSPFCDVVLQIAGERFAEGNADVPHRDADMMAVTFVADAVQFLLETVDLRHAPAPEEIVGDGIGGDRHPAQRAVS